MAENLTAEQIFFPIRQADSASQADARNLLARAVYGSLRGHVQERLNDATRSTPHASNQRHAAVLVDGARGSGKSSVLLNLKTYLESEDKQLLGRVHVLKPIDPTLLEDHDDLFLNIVVAAVLSDQDVKGALAHESVGRTNVYKRLHLLGHALENMQTQRDKKGLDKIRAFIGNQELVNEVHQFFDAVLKLLGKQLLVLPVDDVDTSLHRAFENLEVVRRYLTSPLVLPVISGDAGLYHDVTWRDIHRRLLKDSRSEALQAKERAKELATEYHRKVLPLQYRLSMPNMDQYFGDDSIVLGEMGSGSLTFPHFHAWLEGLLNDRVNGVENSHLPVPVHTLRAFAQLAYRVRGLIPALDKAISDHRLSKEMLRHHMLMPQISFAAIRAFKHTYESTEVTGDTSERRSSRDTAYSEFLDRTSAVPRNYSSPLDGISIAQWISTLGEHFRSDAKAGAAYLVLKAYGDWASLKNRQGNKWISVFDTSLFQPALQTSQHPHFEAVHDLADWAERLSARVPEGWLKKLSSATILPYPVPEIGPLVSVNATRTYLAANVESDLRLLTELLLHRNFYQRNKTGMLLCVGRMFELVITSLMRDMTASDIAMVLSRPPFFSVGALAQTKTLGGDAIEQVDVPDIEADPMDLTDEMAKLAGDINQWRAQLKLRDLHLSPWLVYNVMNKFFNQAWIFNAPSRTVSAPDSFAAIAWVGRKAFNSIWAAFGSFEKGERYGFPPIIATVNVGDGADFQRSDLYRQNITPFVGEKSGVTEFGRRVGAITALLESHPLKLLTDRLPVPSAQALSDEKKETNTAVEGRIERQNPSDWLFEYTGKKQYDAAARRILNLPIGKARELLKAYEEKYQNPKLRDAINRVGQVKKGT
ncbi:antiviral RADAR system adenosine triphosphatase RdrA [Massilia niabensis]|uniref:Antiviral RADAR system adenosine triphosphatase RdrA n=1 Tax=Massilia niabensis TaxID=544910 RepID=A0ABW0L1S8_9BURK